MVMETNEHPETLKTAVCSPGGTTIEGVHALEDGAFRATTMNAVKAAYDKTLKLAGK
jgi:pyrroline-5-carboxylate reductase